MSHLIKLKELHIEGCHELKYLWQDGNEMLNLTCLQELTIKSCPQFTSFVVGETEIELPCNLDKMELSNCTSLEKLPSKMYTLTYLCIGGCPKLIRPNISSYDPNNNNPMSQLESSCTGKCDSLTFCPFANGRLATLKTFVIGFCEGVELLEEITIESLKDMDIYCCPNLRSLPQFLLRLSHLTKLSITDCQIEDFPPLPLTLSSLTLMRCPNIKTITSITSCNNLTYLSERGALEIIDSLPLPIGYVFLDDCPKIKSLPKWCHLTSLWFIYIRGCQNIQCLPEGGLPPNLQEFHFLKCENMKQPLREWGLPLLTSLTSLAIDGRSMGGEGEKVRFPSEEEDEEDAWSLLFPSSLTRLAIEMRNVERL
ncbi:probable disease resistance protein RPP1 [Eucalyptus grandis]|uniref:probable disease resistance protein RPP1 n=1 Tax=Eucalyptus grandis TaxID=71139 RepID=UPI00192EFF19|nr:probable disease resistance protein RPP1 [Eucalyptus grandis]XP_039163389.1 probable disease resistance protein RPP1 [Eucalyptus grandis]XP_039163390.1 probable disease resistance protein RPP1 [Eucalyptus grandis]XP_039163391.1 probable disease resistance protein RPP1 [Eucalyptus grandis]XP_039163392.1 probable disease resistance protein RPP1 [Eucalyptus grandis]XP_039163393.1 probable disease resistance protein RPP1 [Eucalyptus grandis]XP_039163394.1 probable disease resistance protein RP